MRKIALAVDALRVDSFVVEDAPARGGTVAGHSVDLTATGPDGTTCLDSCRACLNSHQTDCFCTVQYGNC